MAETCPECGAALAEGGACMDLFHALLLLEYEVAEDAGAIAGGRGEVAHFHAVSSYGLQHPEGMGYTVGAIGELRRNLADQLAGRISLAALRAKVRRGAEGPARVTRRPGEEVPRWAVGAWPMTVADVVAGGAAGYCERVAAWATSILATLDEAEGVGPGPAPGRTRGGGAR